MKANTKEIKYYIKQCNKLATLFAILLGLFMLLMIGFIEFRPAIAVISMVLAIICGSISNYFNNYQNLLCNKLYLIQRESKR